MTRLKLALFGTNGHQIHGLVGQLERAGVVGAADVPAATFAEWRKKTPDVFSEARRYESLAEMLDAAKPDLVSICSARRDRQHEDVVQALDAGAHVYAEKPLATSLAGLEAIIAAAQRSGNELRAMTGMRYDPAFREMKELVDAGKLGEVVQVFAQKSYPYHDRRPQDTGVDGGLLMQAGIHAVSLVRFVTGLELEQITAVDTRRGNPRDGDLRIAGVISARMTGGALCTILCNYCNPPGIGFWGNDQLRVFGTGGMAEVMDGGRRSLVCIGKEEPRPLADSRLTGGYEALLRDYVEHLLDGTPMLLSQEDCFEETRVVLRAQQAADAQCVTRDA